MSAEPPAEPTDETLLRQMAGGDEAALVELHARYARLLTALGYRMLRQREDVDACVQDAFMNAWRHAARFDPSRARAKTWLVSIAHHRPGHRRTARRTGGRARPSVTRPHLGC